MPTLTLPASTDVSSAAERADWMSNVVDEVIRAIEESELTQYELAKLSGVDRASISRFVRRQRSLGLDSLQKVCNVLGLELAVKKRRR
jgi:transcriptional regulator with XRE-family HTH domain